MQIVGITGFKRSGKGTVASILSSEHDGVVYEVGFADKLKIIAAQALGFDRPPRDLIALMDEFKLDGRITVEYREPGESVPRLHDITGREYLQQFGTRCRQLFGEDFWVDQVLPRPSGHSIEGLDAANVKALYPEVDCVAITDLRFENEARRVKALGGVVWAVERPGCVSDGHDSEQSLPEPLIDWHIHNAWGLDHLEREVLAAMEATLRC